VADVTALKALSTSSIKAAFLKAEGREGVFNWLTGDYSSQVTADAYSGVYVKADDTSASSGAWVRDFDGDTVDPRWYGAKGDGSTDDTTAVQAAIDSGFNVRLPSGHTFMIGAAGIAGQSNQEITGENRFTSILKLSESPTSEFIVYSS